MENVLSVREACVTIRRIVIRQSDPEVCRTVAEAWRESLSPDAAVTVCTGIPLSGPGTLAIALTAGGGVGAEGRLVWRENGAVELEASHVSALFPLFSLIEGEWSERPVSEFAKGVTYHPTFPWLRNLNEFFVGSLRTARRFNRESFVRQLARTGFTHVTVNGLGVPRPYESSPPGDVYHWFYDYSPDLDQFVDSALLRGYYPPDYLRANCNALRASAALVRKYGLIPGLHINSPRSMPDEFWHRYGYLRGARVDHPRETLRPRYALAMAHPVVQRHYRELIGNILREVPDLGFVHIWTNDSGAGFEFVSSLYAGRNGGPYLLREWKGDETIARAAAANVMTYYRLLAEEGRRANPAFRLVCDLGPFFAERKYIIPELGNGIDAGDFAFFEEPPGSPARDEIEGTGAQVHRKLDICDNNVLGVPAPFLVHERVLDAYQGGARALLANVAPPSLVPFDINGEVVRSIQLHQDEPLEELLQRCARRWAGKEHGSKLVNVWKYSDAAVRAYPPEIPMSTFGFPWFRLWVRPFVPDIDAIAEGERAYYEDFLLATFNNPARVDLNNDMMWNFLTVDQAGSLRRRVDEHVLPPLAKAIGLCSPLPDGEDRAGGAVPVFADLCDRLVAAQCYYTTMRNTVAWTEAVHGYVQASSAADRVRFRTLCEDMVAHELANARTLLALWNSSAITFMPISALGESLHIYGENFGALLERKIALMERHAHDEPRIDPDYMWRMKN
jgi:hypothetical protein